MPSPQLPAMQSPLSTTAPVPAPTALEKSQPGTMEPFDIISALWSAGVPHIKQQILCYLDCRSLLMSEMVSTLWRDIIGELSIWKYVVPHDTVNSTLLRDLLERRGWHKYLEGALSRQMPSHFYRHLYQIACRDIQSLEENWRRGHCTLTRVQTGSAVRCLQYDDNKIVTGHGGTLGGDNTIKIWDRSTLQVSKVLEGHYGALLCLQYNEKVLISGSADQTVKVWDIQTGQVINDLLHHKGAVCSLKFTTDTLVTGSHDGTVGVWNVKSSTDITLRMTLTGHKNWVFAVELSETIIISGSGDETIKVWDKFTGELIRTLCGHSGWVYSLQLQGSHLISGSTDKTIRIWKVDTGECVRVLHGHCDWINCVAVDNKRILSGGYNKTIKVWDLAAALDSGSSSDTLCITTLEDAAVRGIQFDAFQVISDSPDGTLVIHDFLDPTPPILRTG